MPPISASWVSLLIWPLGPGNPPSPGLRLARQNYASKRPVPQGSKEN